MHRRDSLIDDLSAAIGCAAVFDAHAVSAAPRGKGAYVLAIRLDNAVDVLVRREGHRLPPGWYLYCGSAYGSGGMAARLRRHLRRDKALHWHVDRLTCAAEEIVALAVTNGRECDLVTQLSASGRFRPALPGFGSSDCARCASHLLEIAH